MVLAVVEVLGELGRDLEEVCFMWFSVVCSLFGLFWIGIIEVEILVEGGNSVLVSFFFGE